MQKARVDGLGAHEIRRVGARAVYRPDLYEAALGRYATAEKDRVAMKLGPAFPEGDIEDYIASLTEPLRQ